MPEKLEKCVKEVKAKSGKKVNPWAVCSKSTGIKKKKGGGWTKGDVKNESIEPPKKDLVNFINNICNNDYAAAKVDLHNIVERKLKEKVAKCSKKS